MPEKNPTPETPDAPQDPAAPAEPKKKPTRTSQKAHYAHRHILHEDKPIVRGSKLPDDFPDSSLDALLKSGAVALSPPAPTKTEVKKGDPA
jgi:hypothetical protein